MKDPSHEEKLRLLKEADHVYMKDPSNEGKLVLLKEAVMAQARANKCKAKRKKNSGGSKNKQQRELLVSTTSNSLGCSAEGFSSESTYMGGEDLNTESSATG